MRRIIVGTAGHIDHGKTTLVRALTGIDCDRWIEEKERGITIDLGFAFLREGDLQIGFVDVPGHERFVHNALAGLGGIRLMMLVVAADEGVKPQTREHLAICSLLGIPAGLVVLTKTDMVEPDLVELAALEAEELLEGTPFAGSPVLTVSSHIGEGIPALRDKLLELAEAHVAAVDREQPTRLPVDRVFHLKGLGVVSTGTLAAGIARPGDTLELLPPGKSARVRSIQVHGEGREEALAGERTSLQLTGLELGEISRGMQLTTPGALRASNRLLARFRLLADAPSSLSGWVPVRLHLYSSEVLGALRPLVRESVDRESAGGEEGRPRNVFEPGDSGLVELKLAAPVVPVRGDRFIVRRPSPAVTLGGGEILDPQWRRPKGRFLEQALSALATEARQALAYWVTASGERGQSDNDLAQRLGTTPSRLEPDLAALAQEQTILEIPAGQGRERRWIAPATFERIVERAQRVLKLYFKNDRLARGIPKAEAVRRILPGRASELSSVYFEWLEKQRTVVVQEGLVTLPGRSVELTGEESALSQAVLRLFDEAGLTPPSPSEAQAALQAKPQILEGVIRYQVQRGSLVRLPGGLILASSALNKLRTDLEASGWERFSVSQFKDRFDLSRKWAIPLLEHLDSIGATRRLGDERMLVRVSSS